MTVKEFFDCFATFVRQSIVPTLPSFNMKGTVNMALRVMEAKPSLEQDLINHFPILDKMGLVKDGIVDANLATVAIEGFFEGGNTFKVPLEWNVLFNLVFGDKSLYKPDELTRYYELTGDDAKKFCDILKARMPQQPMARTVMTKPAQSA